MFKFKQFEVDQRNCAMKINTDGVLLGSIADHPHAGYILDIGAGTGVIALMLAQRFGTARVDAVEIEPGAAATADDNFKNSPFADRLKSFSTSFEEFNAPQQYDLIVSNPPFFVNDLKNEEEKKTIARHTDADFFDVLLQKSSELLTDDGLLWIILPPVQAELTINNAPQYGLSLLKSVAISSFKNKAVFRQIVCFAKHVGVFKHEHFVLYDSPGVYSAVYNILLKDFFLAL